MTRYANWHFCVYNRLNDEMLMVFWAAVSRFDVLWADSAEPVTSRCEWWYFEGQCKPPRESSYSRFLQKVKTPQNTLWNTSGSIRHARHEVTDGQIVQDEIRPCISVSLRLMSCGSSSWLLTCTVHPPYHFSLKRYRNKLVPGILGKRSVRLVLQPHTPPVVHPRNRRHSPDDAA